MKVVPFRAVRRASKTRLEVFVLGLALFFLWFAPAQALDVVPVYSATWEKGSGGGGFCDDDADFDRLLSATGTFQVGFDDSFCNADVRGVLEFDLAGLPGTILSAQLTLRHTGGYEMAQTVTVHGFSGNGATDQADANVENVLTTFAAPGIGNTVVIDVTGYVNALLGASATHAGFTLDAGAAAVASFAGLSDPGEAVLAVDDGQQPVADAGVDQTLVLGAEAILDGNGSSDPDGNLPLSFAWQILAAPQGSAAAVSGAATSSPSLTPDVLGAYVIELVVTDTEAKASDPDTVTVRAQGHRVVESGYSATWEKEVGGGFLCEADTDFDQLLSSAGTFQAGLDDAGCDAEVRGVLEFDLSGLPGSVIGAQLVLQQNAGSGPVSDSFTVHGFSGNGLVDQADANIDNAVASFSPPGIGEQIVIDVTGHLNTLLGSGATHAGLTIDGGSANYRSFDGTGDPEPPRLHLFLAPTFVPAIQAPWILGLAIAGVGARWLRAASDGRRCDDGSRPLRTAG